MSGSTDVLMPVSKGPEELVVAFSESWELLVKLLIVCKGHGSSIYTMEKTSR
jgi:hypothetical protein